MNTRDRHGAKRPLLNGDGQHPFLVIRRDAHPWRKVTRFLTTARPDDQPWRCLSCRQTVLVGQSIVVARSAHEQTQGCYGPIESAVHADCWWTVLLTQPDAGLPELGPKGARMEKYGSDYAFGPKW